MNHVPPKVTDWTPGSEAVKKSSPDFTLPDLLGVLIGVALLSGVFNLVTSLDPQFFLKEAHTAPIFALVAFGATIVCTLGWLSTRRRAWTNHETRNRYLKDCIFQLVNIEQNESELLRLTFRSPHGLYEVKLDRSQLFYGSGISEGIQFPGATWTHAGKVDFGPVALVAESDWTKFGLGAK